MSKTLIEYEDWVTAKMSSASMADFNAKIGTAGLGLGGEGGECADLAKKVLFHGMEFTEEVKQKFIKELGDTFFYLAFAARNVCGVSLQDVLDANVEKLDARYKEGFTVEEFMAKEKAKED